MHGAAHSSGAVMSCDVVMGKGRPHVCVVLHRGGAVLIR